MAKDDYDVILFKVLLYLYACFKGKAFFRDDVFREVVGKAIPDAYLIRILMTAQNESLIEGLTFMRVWGNEYILTSQYTDMAITPEGIHHLEDNGKMRQVKTFLTEHAPELISTLITLVL
jgi:hypothetical protein